MAKLMTCTILLRCSCIVNTLEFQTIGVYSICGKNYTQYEFTQFGFAVNLTVSAVFENPKSRKSIFSTLHDTNQTSIYKSFDVCYDKEKLVSVVTEILLDSELYAVNKSIVLQEKKLEMKWTTSGARYFVKKFFYYHVKAKRSTMIVRIITHIPEDMLQIFLNIMSMEVIPISKHSPLVKSNDRMNERPIFYNMEHNFTDVEKYLKRKMLKDVIVLRLKVGNLHTSDFNGMAKMLKQINSICLKTLTIDNENESLKLIQNIEAIFNKNRTKHFILILVGGFSAQKTTHTINYWKYVNMSSSYYKNIVAISPYPRLGMEHPFQWSVILYEPVRATVENQGNYIETLEMIKRKYHNDIVNLIVNNNLATFGALLMSFHSTFAIFQSSTRQYRWSDLITLLHENFKFTVAESTIVLDYIPAKMENKCYHLGCLPGYEITYGKVPNKTSLWDEEIAYYCQPCKSNYVKPSYGDDRCQPCVHHFVSDPDKTKCVDPLLSVYHKPGDTSGIITFGICIVGAFLCLLAIVILIKYRETPIVKTSDFTMSLVHLTAILLFFCNMPALYFTTPTLGICMARTLSIALLYNLNISMICTKSNKLVKAFSTKIRSTKTEVLKTTFMQAFTIIMSLLSACLLVIALWSHKYPALAIRLDIQHSKKILYCNNGHDNIALCGMMLLVQLVCFIQAFRCRKLPGHISEAMSIVYASFIVTVSLCVMFPINFFQKYEENGELVLVLVLSGNNLILFLFMYAKKLFVIIFCSEKNTKESFRRKQMEMIEVNARKIR